MSNHRRGLFFAQFLSAISFFTFFTTPHAETVVGSIPGSFNVSPSGAATYSIPIEVPPGVNGLQPGLSLEYNSQSGNGLLGMGWALGGLSSINRCPKTLAQDGIIHGVDFTNADRLCLDGQRLVLVNGVNADDTAYWSLAAEYRTENESFSKITRYGSGFKVETRDARVGLYGTTVDSEQNVKIIKTGAIPILSWAVNKISDSSNNNIAYIYYENELLNDHRIYNISYSNNIGTKVGSIGFGYENKADVMDSYYYGITSKDSFRLTSIDITSYNQSANINYATYTLSYSNSNPLGNSQLIGLTKCANLTNCLKSDDFSWLGNSTAFSGAVNKGIIDAGYKERRWWADFNGDGLTDFCRATGAQNNVSTTIKCELSSPNGFGATVISSVLDLGYAEGAGMVDVNGDGRADFCRVVGSVNNVNTPVLCTLSAGSSFGSTITSSVLDWGYQERRWWADFNGDGLPDFCRATGAQNNVSTTIKCTLSTANGFGTTVTSSVLDLGYAEGAEMVDVNGDGRADFCRVVGSVNNVNTPVLCTLSAGSSFGATITSSVLDWGYQERRWWADFNGDGFPDFCRATGAQNNVSTTIKCTLSTANGFGTTVTSSVLDLGYAEGAQMVDINGDGRADFCRVVGSVNNVNTPVLCTLSAGSSFGATITSSVLDWGYAEGRGWIDVDGDGRPDYCRIIGATSYQLSCNKTTYNNPLLIGSIQNGLGVKTTVTYTPITNNSIYTKDTTNNPVGYIPAYPILDYQAPMQVVNSVTIDNGLGGQNTTSYKYGGMKVHLRGRGNLGFRTMEVTGPTGLFTKTEFSQDYHTAGMLLTATTKASSAINAVVLSSTVVTPASDITKVPFSGTLLNSWGDMKDERWLSYVNKSTTTKRDLGNNSLGTTVSQTVLDSFGNATSATVTTTDPVTYIAYKKVTTNQFANAYSSVWCQIGQLTQTQSYSEVNGVQSTPITKIFAYNSICKLEIETAEPDTTNWVTSTYGPYDSFGNNTKIEVSGQGITTRSTTTTYDSNGQFPVTVKNAMGHTETRVFDPRFGVVTSNTGPNGITTTSQYDDFGRPTVMVTAEGNRTEITRQWCTTGCTVPAIKPGYYAQKVSYIITTRQKGSNLVEFTPPTKVYYDQFNREVRRESVAFDGTAIYVDTNYNALGQVVVSTSPYFSNDIAANYASEFQYDLLGAIKYQTDSTGTAVAITRNGLTTTYNTTIQNPTRTERKVENYTVIGQLKSVQDNAFQTTNFGYDVNGNRITTTDPLGHVVTVDYDKFGRKISMNDPDMGAWIYTYNVLGELISQRDAKLQTTSMQYDILGRMVKRTDHDGLVSDWIYNDNLNAGNTPGYKAIGKLNVETSSNSYRREFNFDGLGRPSYEVVMIGATNYRTDTSYDIYGRPDVLSYPSSVGRFQAKNFYQNGQLLKVTSADGITPYWQADFRNAAGQVQSDHYGNNLQIMRTFDVAGRATWINIGDAATLYEARYAYDSIGNLTQRKSKRNQGSGVELVEDYVYDTLNRITNVNSAQLPAMQMTYDGMGNITSKTGVGAYTYSATKPHAVVAVPGKTYNYDANGNMINGAGRTVTWASYNYPTVLESAQAKSTFSYGPGRARFMQIDLDKTTNGTQITHYVSPLFERVQNTSGIFEYKHYINAGGQTIGVHTRRSNNVNDTNYLLRDYQGTVVAVVDSAGVAKGHLDYDAFGARRPILGQTTVSTIIQTNPRGYTGHEHLDKLNLIHMNGRVFDPALARFMSADPMVQAPENLQSLNRYSYGFNNPMSFTDPSGFWSLRRSLNRLKDRARKVVGQQLHIAYSVMGFETGEFKQFARRNEKLQKAAQIAAGIADGSGICAGICSAGTAAYLTELNGGSYEDMGRAGINAYATYVVLKSLNEPYKTWDTWRVLGNASAGGTMSHLTGGKYADGFKLRLITSTLAATYSNTMGHDATFDRGNGLASNDGTYNEANGVPNGPIVFGTNTSPLSASGDIFGDFWKQGGALSVTANQIPGMNSLAMLHDYYQISLDRLAGSIDSSMRTWLNVPAMIPATIINYGALVNTMPVIP